MLYCENGQCRVELFNDGKGMKAEKNCPGCGQFGREKGKQ